MTEEKYSALRMNYENVSQMLTGLRLFGDPTCHFELFASCHSERSEESDNAQDRLREESRPFASAQGDKTNNLNQAYAIFSKTTGTTQ